MKQARFPEKFNTTDEPPAALSRKKKEKGRLPTLGMTNGRGKGATDSTDIESVARDRYNQLYANRFGKSMKFKKTLLKELYIQNSLSKE